MTGATSPKIGVLFMQSQEYFGADSQIHASIMLHLDRNRFDVHCALATGRDGVKSASANAIAAIPQLHVRPTEFGPTLEVRAGVHLPRDLARYGIPSAISLLGLALYVRRNRIRIIHCTEKPRDAFYGALVAALGGARLLIHVHVKAETWIRRIVRWSMGRAAALIAVSAFVARSIGDLGYAPSRIFTVLNGLELDNLIGANDDVAAVRAEFGIPPTAPLILSASRLYRYKGQHDLLAALPTVKSRFPDVRLVISGDDDPRGYDGEASYSDALKRQCDELNLQANVIFAGFRSDMRRLMAACDIYAMPSFEEPFGMVFIEAMSLARPVVALASGGTQEVVAHGVSGLLSAPGDRDALAANIIRLLQDPELRRTMGEHGRRRVIDHLNAGRMTRDVERIYATIVGKTV